MDAPCRQSIKKETWNLFLKNKEKGEICMRTIAIINLKGGVAKTTCSRCGKRIQSGSRCPCQKERHREYDRYSRDNKSKGLN